MAMRQERRRRVADTELSHLTEAGLGLNSPVSVARP